MPLGQEFLPLIYNMFNMAIAYGLLLLSLFIIIAWQVDQLNVAIRLGAPFVPAPKAVLEAICGAMSITDGSVVYELGCGDARVLRALYSVNPKAKYIGVERQVWVFLLANIKNKLARVKGIKLIRGNLYDTNVSDATHIFLWIFPDMMQKLLPLLTTSLKPGTKVVAMDFPFTAKEPTDVIKTDYRYGNIAKTLYVYKF